MVSVVSIRFGSGSWLLVVSVLVIISVGMVGIGVLVCLISMLKNIISNLYCVISVMSL